MSGTGIRKFASSVRPVNSQSGSSEGHSGEKRAHDAMMSSGRAGSATPARNPTPEAPPKDSAAWTKWLPTRSWPEVSAGRIQRPIHTPQGRRSPRRLSRVELRFATARSGVRSTTPRDGVLGREGISARLTD